VRRQYYRGRLKRYLKSNAGRRELPLSPGMARNLWTARPPHATGPLFATRNGTRLQDRNVRRVLDAVTHAHGGEVSGWPMLVLARCPAVDADLTGMSEFDPTLRVDEIAGRVRLSLDGLFSAEGVTLQEAADELVWKMLVALMAFRSRGVSGLSVMRRPDWRLVDFLWELDKIASAGGDIRERLFGPTGMAA